MFSDEQFAGFNRNSIMSDDLINPYDYYTPNKKDNNSFYNTFIEEFSYKGDHKLLKDFRKSIKDWLENKF